MDIKKLAIGGIVGGILFFLLGWLLFGMLLVDFMKNHAGVVSGFDKTPPDMLYLIIGNLASGLLLTYIFVKTNVNSLTGGLITGAVLGALTSVSVDCIMYGTTKLVSKNMMMADVLASVGMWAVAGAVLGLLLGKLK
jgi:uncharacterized membrane protein